MTTRKPVMRRSDMAPQAARSPFTLRILLGAILCAGALSLLVSSTAAADTRMKSTYQTTQAAAGSTTTHASAFESTSVLDMRDDQYNNDYIFGMTKGVANSTIIGAVKPIFFLITIPLDIAFLPFAAIGGFF